MSKQKSQVNALLANAVLRLKSAPLSLTPGEPKISVEEAERLVNQEEILEHVSSLLELIENVPESLTSKQREGFEKGCRIILDTMQD